jgi:hypothetical protein
MKPALIRSEVDDAVKYLRELREQIMESQFAEQKDWRQAAFVKALKHVREIDVVLHTVNSNLHALEAEQASEVSS